LRPGRAKLVLVCDGLVLGRYETIFDTAPAASKMTLATKVVKNNSKQTLPKMT